MALLRQLGLKPGDALLPSSPYEPSPVEVLLDYFEARHSLSTDEVRYPRDPEDLPDDVANLIGPVGVEAVKLVQSDPSQPRLP